MILNHSREALGESEILIVSKWDDATRRRLQARALEVGTRQAFAEILREVRYPVTPAAVPAKRKAARQ